MSEIEFLHLNWGQVQHLTEKVASKISTSKYNVDMIVAVSRGGFGPGRILCDQLIVRRLTCIQMEAYDGITKRLEPIVVIPLKIEADGLHILIVDDVSDTGSSLLVAKKHVEEKGAVEVRVATLHIKPWSSYIPDYYSSSSNKWIVYPWERKECILEVAKLQKKCGYKGAQLRDRMIKLGFSRLDVKKYLENSINLGV